MIIHFSSCGLGFSLRADSIFANALRSVLSGYSSTQPGKIRLRFRLANEINPNSLQTFLGKKGKKSKIGILGWGKNKVDLGLVLPDGDAISAAIAIGLLNGLVYNQGLLFHGTCLFEKSGAYVFLGRSGAGKSTIAQQATGFEYTHQDRVALRKTREAWMAYGVPLRDNDGLPGKNVQRRVSRIFIIEKSGHNECHGISAKCALQLAQPHVFMPFQDPIAIMKTGETLFELVSQVPFSILQFSRDFDFGKWCDGRNI